LNTATAIRFFKPFQNHREKRQSRNPAIGHQQHPLHPEIARPPENLANPSGAGQNLRGNAPVAE
jgi:hypothetical protein